MDLLYSIAKYFFIALFGFALVIMLISMGGMIYGSLFEIFLK